MAERMGWALGDVDARVPSAARIYDYLLGGGHNFAVDRALVEKLLRAHPNISTIARLNRAFLRRSVLFMIEHGIRQFLDLGSGIPTVGNVHEIAQKADPDSRVVYVDLEDVAVAHSRILLENDPNAIILQEDVTETDAVLRAARDSRLLDFDQPIGVLAVAVIHLVPTERDANRVVAAYRDAVVPGSFLALSHFTADLQPEEMARFVEVMKTGMNPVFPRTHAEITTMFEGFGIVEPGVVVAPLWRPEAPNDDDQDTADIYAGVGRKL